MCSVAVACSPLQRVKMERVEMKQTLITITVAGVVTLFAVVDFAGAQDLRDRFGTRSLEAAKRLGQGIQLSQKRLGEAALPHLEAAIKADADLQLARYWKASTLVDLGRVDEGLRAYQSLVDVGERTSVTNVTVDGCINLALIYARLEDEQKASHWFSRAIMLDPSDSHKLHWKAYRNMAIGLSLRGDYDSAAMCAIQGYLAEPQRVEFRMVLDFLEKSDDSEEVVEVLHFPDASPTVLPREETASLTEVTNDFTFPAPITDLLLDSQNNSIIAISRGKQQWHIIRRTVGLKVTPFTASGPISCATVVDGEVYLCVDSPARMEKVDPSTSRVEQKWELPHNLPTSIAVVPVQDVAFFADRRMLQRMDLRTGRVTETEYYSDGVTSDPLQKFCYSYIRDEGESGHVYVNGRSIRFSLRDRWTQTSLSKYAVAERDLLLAAVRMNAASNGRRLYVSPGGHWVASVGGGGWRPTSSGQGTGYGVAVFATSDLSKIQGFYQTDAYPLGIAVNPVTGQVAAIRKNDATIHQLARSEDAVTLTGPFNGSATWSADGASLYLATEKGMRVWENSLTSAEQQTAGDWIANLNERMAKPKQPSEQAIAVIAVKELQGSSLKNTRNDVLAMLTAARNTSGEVKPIEWLQHVPYQTDSKLKAFFSKATQEVRDASNAGILKYRLEKMQPEHPKNPGFEFLLGMANFSMGKFDKCVEHHLTAIRADQGQTNISVESLRCLAHGHKREDKPMIAAYCMATVLRLDPANPKWLQEARPFFEAADVIQSAKPLLEGRGTTASDPSVHSAKSSVAIPNLAPSASKQKYDGRGLFLKVSRSAVLVRTASGTGSGVCIGRRGLIVTNRHVVDGARGKLQVYPFLMRSGRMTRLPAVDAEVVYESATNDIAILNVANPPKTMMPLDVAMSNPPSGTRIFAIGSPGLGRQILEQSISDGIVSSPSREIDGQSYIQHTAAVNPGNSGGPLVNEMGHVVGLVTLKAGLDNVSFAIPATKLRELFESLQE